jgi:hypothetical protein
MYVHVYVCAHYVYSFRFTLDKFFVVFVLSFGHYLFAEVYH